MVCARQLVCQLLRLVDQDREMLRADPALFPLVIELNEGRVVTRLVAIQAGRWRISDLGHAFPIVSTN